MPLILPGNVGSATATTGYDVANSLRFDDGSSDYLNRTPSSAGNRRTFTISFWVKRSNISALMKPFSAGAVSSPFTAVEIESTDQLRFVYFNGTSLDTDLGTNRLFRDVSAWYHIVCSVDTTQATESNRVKLYVNGNQETSFDSSHNTYPAQNFDFNFNNNQIHEIGRGVYNSAENFDGYLAEFIMIDGTQLDPTSFGEFDEDTGIWKPKDVSGLTFGTNGFYLDFENASSLGADVSGNSNNFTVNNLTSVDQSTDTCTNNFCTFNSLVNVPYSTYSEGNLFVDVTSTGNSSHKTNYGNIAFNSGKWYWEAKALGGSKYTIGLSDANNQSNYQQVAGTNNIVGRHSSYVSGDAIGYYFDAIYKNGSSVASSLHTIVTNDIMMVAVDADNGKIYFGVNGTWRVANSTTFDPAQNDTTFTTGEFYVSAFSNEDCDWSVNWGSPAYSISSGNSDAEGFGNFEYAVPSGFFSLCSKNLAEYG